MDPEDLAGGVGAVFREPTVHLEAGQRRNEAGLIRRLTGHAVSLEFLA